MGQYRVHEAPRSIQRFSPRISSGINAFVQTGSFRMVLAAEAGRKKPASTNAITDEAAGASLMVALTIVALSAGGS